MKKAIAVIGSAWGDEGKGLMVDYYAAKNPGAMVVRHSAGANAGHTVQLADGRRHVFSHFGSGTFAGASTYLSEYFISHPFLWEKEIAELRELGVEPKLYIDGSSLLSTPYDALINRALEQSRGVNRHGSCGSGINETVVRCSTPRWSTVCAHTIWDYQLKGIVREIRDIYVPRRMEDLGISFDQETADIVASDKMLDKFIQACVDMRTASTITNHLILTGPEPIIFEGSQGLALDAEHRFFPHVTRARTGLTNVIELAHKVNLDVDVTYVTRAYATRHGDGPFPQYVEGLSYLDPTNHHNDWQGTMRFGHLDIDFMANEIKNDLASNGSFVDEVNLAITCIDQVPATDVQYAFNGEKKKGTWRNLVADASSSITASQIFCSFGPRRDHVARLETNNYKAIKENAP